MFNLLASILHPNAAENVATALRIMWQGVLAIFVVIGIIIGITYLLNKITAPKKKDENKQDEE